MTGKEGIHQATVGAIKVAFIFAGILFSFTKSYADSEVAYWQAIKSLRHCDLGYMSRSICIKEQVKKLDEIGLKYAPAKFLVGAMTQS